MGVGRVAGKDESDAVLGSIVVVGGVGESAQVEMIAGTVGITV